ncbi:MAG: MopE-related protein, partial [Candidatus Woesearchaeota archaeon]|nr:MopE-related protein [Candidatus Woesearchaeota archaeon]
MAIKKLVSVLYFFLVVGMLNFVVGFEEYESNPYFASGELTVSDTCTCVPNNINGVPSPEGCWPYDGCLGDGSGPCDDGIDNDCDCKTDCYDPSCGLDCDDCSGTCDDPNCAGLPLGPGGEVCSPGGEPVEFCVDGFDNDADGYVDECDADCNGEENIQSSDIAPYYSTTEVCDEYDNDCDGSVDEEGVCDSSCSSDSDCGTNGWVGYSSCIYDDAYQYYRTYTCNDARGVSSYCTHEDTQQKKSECYDEYSYCDDWDGNYCKDGDAYKSRECREQGCLRGACYGTAYTDEQLVEDCDYGCGEGKCLRHCENGIWDGDEEGVDCGGSCNLDCCDNGYQDEDLGEEGVDCGRDNCDFSCVVPVLLVHGYLIRDPLNVWEDM